MSYESAQAKSTRYTVIEKLNALPDDVMYRISDYIDFVTYEITIKKKSEVEIFNEESDKMQAQVEAAGATEQDLYDLIKEVRAEKRTGVRA